MSFVTRMQGAFSLRLLSLKELSLSLSLSLSLLYIHTCGLSSFLKNVFILFLDLQKRVRVDQIPSSFLSLSLSASLHLSLFESCLRDNNRDD